MSNIWTPFPEKDVWELQRIFLKSESGYTPLLFVDSILRGIIFGKEREWTIFRGCAGFSKRDLLREVGWHMPQDKNHTFWKNNGHALSYEEICNWIETGCDSAVTLEELLAANPGVLCEAGTLTDFNNVTS